MIPSASDATAPALAPPAGRREGPAQRSMLAVLRAEARGALAVLLSCSVALGGVLLAATGVGKALYQALLAPADRRGFALLLLAGAGLVLLHAALRVARTVAIGALAHRLAAALQADALDELLRYRYRFFVARRSAEIWHGLEDDCGVMAERVARAAAGLADGLLLALWAAFFVPVVPGMVALIAAAAAFAAAWALLWRRTIARSDAAIGHRYTALWHVVVQAVLGVRAVKLDGLKRRFARLLDGAAARLHAEFRHNFLANAAAWEVLSALPWVLLGAYLCLAVSGLRRGSLTMGEVVFGLLFLERLAAPLAGGMAGLLSAPGFEAARGSLERLLTGDLEREGPSVVRRAPRALELREVRYRHPGTRFQAPRGALEFLRGHHTAIVGQTGCGKSTLLALCTRLLEPEGGGVLLDGVDVDRLVLASLRATVVAVHQDSRIFRGTLRSNLDVRGSLPDEALCDLLERAGLGYLAARGRGLDAPVSDGGAELSGGERQRITVLRAVALAPWALLLDEPTSALDAPTARRLCQLLYPRDGSTTTVTVTHSPLVLEHMDRVYRVVGDRVEEVA